MTHSVTKTLSEEFASGEDIQGTLQVLKSCIGKGLLTLRAQDSWALIIVQLDEQLWVGQVLHFYVSLRLPVLRGPRECRFH